MPRDYCETNDRLQAHVHGQCFTKIIENWKIKTVVTVEGIPLFSSEFVLSISWWCSWKVYHVKSILIRKLVILYAKSACFYKIWDILISNYQEPPSDSAWVYTSKKKKPTKRKVWQWGLLRGLWGAIGVGRIGELNYEGY